MSDSSLASRYRVLPRLGQRRGPPIGRPWPIKGMVHFITYHQPVRLGSFHPVVFYQ